MAPLRPIDFRPRDALVRWLGPSGPPPALAHDGENVAWLGTAKRGREVWVTGVGENPRTVADLVREIANIGLIDGVTVDAPVFPMLPVDLRSPDPGLWSLWTLDPATNLVGPREVGVRDLAMDDPRISALLQHSASAYMMPGNPRLEQWVGVEISGELVSVAARVTEPSGAAQLVSVCTHPHHRGRGYAKAVCARLVHVAKEQRAPQVILEMYTANEAGRRVYTSLGFKEAGRYASGLLEHALQRPHRS